MFERCIEFGRIAFIAYGHDSGKICAIVDIIDQNRVIVDGPCSDVKRQAMNIKQLQLTKFVIPTPHGSRTKTVKKLWEKEGMTEKWNDTKWAKKLEMKKVRQSMNDYDRFKLMRAKQQRNLLVRIAVAGLRKEQKSKK